MMTAIAVVLAAPAFAQQQTDPQLKPQAEALFSKWQQGLNTNDANVLQSIYAPEEFTISAFGVDSIANVEQTMARNKSDGVKVKGSVKEVQQIDSDTALSYGPYEASNNQGSVQGNWMQVLEKQGSDWKVRAMAVARSASPQPATASSGNRQAPLAGSSTPNK